MAFDRMCRGWALGSKDFKRELLESEGLLKHGSFERVRMEGLELQEANELIWESCVERGLEAACKITADIEHERKSAVWKIWIASELKLKTSAPSTWIARRLNMGSPQLVGRYVKGFHQEILETPSGQYDRFIYKYGLFAEVRFLELRANVGNG